MCTLLYTAQYCHGKCLLCCHPQLIPSLTAATVTLYYNSRLRQSTGLLNYAKPEVAGQESRPHEQGLVVRTSVWWEGHKEVPGS